MRAQRSTTPWVVLQQNFEHFKTLHLNFFALAELNLMAKQRQGLRASRSPLATLFAPAALMAVFCCRLGQQLLDTYHHRIRSNQMFHPRLAETRVAHPGGAILTRVVESARRFDQHVETHD